MSDNDDDDGANDSMLGQGEKRAKNRLEQVNDENQLFKEWRFQMKTSEFVVVRS